MPDACANENLTYLLAIDYTIFPQNQSTHIVMVPCIIIIYSEPKYLLSRIY